MGPELISIDRARLSSNLDLSLTKITQKQQQDHENYILKNLPSSKPQAQLDMDKIENTGRVRTVSKSEKMTVGNTEARLTTNKKQATITEEDE